MPAYTESILAPLQTGTFGHITASVYAYTNEGFVKVTHALGGHLAWAVGQKLEMHLDRITILDKVAGTQPLDFVNIEQPCL